MDFVTIALIIAAVWIGVLVVVLAIFKASGQAMRTRAALSRGARRRVELVADATLRRNVGHERSRSMSRSLNVRPSGWASSSRAATHTPTTSGWNSSPPFTTVTVGTVDWSERSIETAGSG